MAAGALTIQKNEPVAPVIRPVAEAPAEPVAVSIVIVTWNSERWIERCLNSIPAACEGLPFEVVVYDNASSDSTMQYVDALAGRIGIESIRSTDNDGFARATNRAVAASNGRYVFMLNPDCELEPKAVTHLVEFLDSRPDAAAAAPLLEDESGDSQREFQLRRLPTLQSFAFELLLIDRLLPRNRATAHYRYHDLDLTTPCRVEQPAAAAFVIRRSVVDAIGPFDERFEPAWFEDVDYCRRLMDRGHSIYVVPASRSRHFGGASLEHLRHAQFLRVWYRNMWLYANKWFSRGDVEALRWMVVAGMLLRCCAAAVGVGLRGTGRAEALRGYRDVLRDAWNRWGSR